MNIILSTLIAIIILLLLVILAVCYVLLRRKHKRDFFENCINKLSDRILFKFKAGPWYLLVFTKDSSCPIWVSNNNIRSIHPDSLNHKIIVKQFNGEDMVIENVENFRWRSASEM